MFAELRVIAIFHFVEIVFVELAYERCEIGMFEETWEDGFGEFVHILL
jgi:hypothetical protein